MLTHEGDARFHRHIQRGGSQSGVQTNERVRVNHNDDLSIKID